VWESAGFHTQLFILGGWDGGWCAWVRGVAKPQAVSRCASFFGLVMLVGGSLLRRKRWVVVFWGDLVGLGWCRGTGVRFATGYWAGGVFGLGEGVCFGVVRMTNASFVPQSRDFGRG